LHVKYPKIQFMKSSLQAFLLYILIMFSYSSTIAQDTTSEKKSYFKLNGNYLSNAVYSGRKDSSVVPYLRSSIGYYNKSGFYIDAGASLLVSATDTKRIDLVTLEAGYTFQITKKLEAEITASKFFYTDKSYSVRSELKAITGIGLGYDAGPVSINGGVDLLFSTNTDVFTSLKISHNFEKGPDNEKWSISPAIELNAGTQYYNQAYYKNRKFTFATTSGSSGNSGNSHPGRGHSNSSSSSSSTTTVKTLVFNDQNKFSILDYEISVPVMYETNRWGLYATPCFAIPVNAASYAVDGVLQKEILTNSFFIEIGAFIKF